MLILLIQLLDRPGENTPELAVTKDDLNAGGHYECPLYGPHALEEPLLKDDFD